MNLEEAKEWISKSCGQGWLPLVEEIYDRVPKSTNISSIYQKWGALHFDAAPWSDCLDTIHEEIEERSMRVCEICGQTGKEAKIDDWIHTRCTNHDKQKNFEQGGTGQRR